MANAVRPKRSNTAAAVPLAGSLAEGEIAVNFADKKIYGKDSGGNVVALSSSGLTVRSDFVSGFMYIGIAASGSSESSAVWTIKKTLVTSAGAISTRTTATGVQWANRLSATYT
jgi:hypothetical protein